VQRADDLVAVRNATIVFCCDGLVRSSVTASWYRQMGLPNVFAVRGGTAAWAAAGHLLERGTAEAAPFGLKEALERARPITPRELDVQLAGDPPTVLFVATSREFAEGHVPGARWLSRSWLEIEVANLVPGKERPVVVTDRDGRSAPLAAAILRDLGYRRVSYLAGGMLTWRTEGLPVEQGLSGVMAPPDDVVPAGPDRPTHDMINYLRWEQALGHKFAAQGP